MNTAILTEQAMTVRPLAFEEEFFDAPVWRIETGDTAQVSASELDVLAANARKEGVALMFCRVPADDPASDTLRTAGFRKVERLVTLSRSIPAAAKMPDDVRIARIEDIDEAAAIGQADFVYDRYHADPQVPPAIADKIKELWVRNGIADRSDAALVAVDGGEVVGFNLCMRRGDDAVIDLIGVASGRQGKGLGRKLVDGALAHYAGRANVMWVGTQDTNHASLALYRAAGFTPQYESDTWHWTA